MTFLQLIRREIHGSLPKLIIVSAVAGVSNAAILTAINAATNDIIESKNPTLWSVTLFIASLFLFIRSQLYVTITTTAEIAPPLPHHLAYGSVPRRFEKLG